MTNRVNAYRPGVTQSITTSGTSAAISNVLGAQTFIIRVHATADAYVALGATADSSDLVIPANGVEYFSVSPGETVAALQVSAAGVVRVTEMTT